MKEMLWKRVKRERGEAITDSLTGLRNRREFNRRLEDLKTKWKPQSPELGGKRSVDQKHSAGGIDKRRQNDFAVIMIDLDHFKVVNDTPGLGHAAGDAVLQQVGELLRSGKVLRAQDFPARYGGEEIVILCPETKLYEGKVVAEKIRAGIANLNPRYNDTIIKITASLGVSSAATTLGIENVVNRADAALYQAKEDGRNLVRGAVPTRHDPYAGDKSGV